VAIAGSPAPAALKCTHPANALGARALTSTAVQLLNTTLTTDIGNGSVNVMTQFLGLGDLTGVGATGFSIGALDGTGDPTKGAPMNNPIDWWFLADPSTVSMGLPTGLFMNAAIANRVLTAGPSHITLTLNLAGSVAPLDLLDATMGGTIDGTPAPNVPAPPPAALAAGLTVFQTITANGFGQGICGDITVASLAKIPVPSVLAQGGGATACAACPASSTYTACTGTDQVGVDCNSLLDVLVGGCGLIPLHGACLAPVINPTQPDVAAGSSVQNLSLGGSINTVTPSPSGDMDAYSAYLTFTANRAHFTGETCSTTSQCQTGKTCTNGACI
jgi:hypothetical protein